MSGLKQSTKNVANSAVSGLKQTGTGVANYLAPEKPGILSGFWDTTMREGPGAPVANTGVVGNVMQNVLGNMNLGSLTGELASGLTAKGVQAAGNAAGLGRWTNTASGFNRGVSAIPYWAARTLALPFDMRTSSTSSRSGCRTPSGLSLTRMRGRPVATGVGNLVVNTS
jgi:hypothetical protein